MTDALKALSQCLSHDPNHSDAHRVLGFVLTALQRFDLAEKEFIRSVQLTPASGESHYALGRLYYQRGAYADAVTSLRRALENQSDDANTHESLGLALEAVNDIKAAERHLLRALELNERSGNPSPWPYISFAGFQNRRANYTGALTHARRALKLAPHSEAAHFHYAKALCGLGQWSSCESELHTAIAIESSAPEFFYLLSIAQRRLGKTEQANASLQEFRRLKTWEASGAASTSRIPQ
jgi:tetratricopeptide (TPR) repeat protein